MERGKQQVIASALAILMIGSVVGTGVVALGSGTAVAQSNYTTEDYTYTASNDGTITATDPDGNVVWSTTLDYSVTASLAVSPDTKYVYGYVDDNAGGRHLVKLDASDGSQVWSNKSLPSDFASLYMGSDYLWGGGESNSKLYKMDPSDGSSIENFGAGGTVHDIRQTSDGDLLFSAYGGTASDAYVTRIDPSGSKVWNQTSEPYGTVKRVQYSEATGKVYAASLSGEYYEFDYSDGSVITSETTRTGVQDLHYSAESNSIYLAFDDGMVERKDGSWSYDTGGSFANDVIHSGGYTYAADGVGNLHKIDDTGSKVFNLSIHSDWINDMTASVERSPSLSETVGGTVTDGDGEPVEGAVVEVLAVNHDNLNGSSADEKRQKAESLLDDSSEVTPSDYYDPNLEPSTDVFRDAGGKYVAVHSREEWGMAGWTDQTDLTNPRVTMDSNEEYIFSVWDSTSANPPEYLDNGVDQDLPGRTTDGTIVIEQVNADGETVNKQTVEPTGTYQTGFEPVSKEHRYASVPLPDGFYRVYPESNEGAAYYVAVGSPQEIVQGWATEMQTEAGDLTAQATAIENRVANNTYQRVTTRTDADGQFAVEVGSSYKTVGVIAYDDGGSGVLSGNSDPSLSDLRSGIQTSDYTGAVYVSQEPVLTTPPDKNVTVGVTQVTAPTYLGMDAYSDKWDSLQQYLDEESYSDLGQAWNTVPTGDTSDEQVREYHDDVTQTIIRSPDASQEVLEKLSTTKEQLKDSNKSISQLRTEIQAVQETISSGESNIDVGDSATEISSKTIDGVETAVASTTIPVSTGVTGDDVTADGVTVSATLGNGSQRVVPDEYISVQSDLTSDDQSIVVEEWPVPGNATTVQFGASVVTSDGMAQTQATPGDNPLVAGEAPEVESISASTLRPTVGNPVEIDVASEDSEYGGVQGATVYDQNGNPVSATVAQDGTVTFTPETSGRHAVQLEIADTSENVYTETIQIDAGSTDRVLAPGVRLASGVTGEYAITGDGVTGASVSRDSDGGLQLGVRVNSGATRPVHVYTTGVTDASSVDIQLLDSNGQVVNQHRSVVLHVDKAPDEALIRRNGDPLIGDAGQVSVNNASSATVIETYTDATGQATVTINTNPTFSESLSYRVDSIVTRYSPDVGLGVLTLDVTGLFGGAAVAR